MIFTAILYQPDACILNSEPMYSKLTFHYLFVKPFKVFVLKSDTWNC